MKLSAANFILMQDAVQDTTASSSTLIMEPVFTGSDHVTLVAEKAEAERLRVIAATTAMKFLKLIEKESTSIIDTCDAMGLMGQLFREQDTYIRALRDIPGSMVCVGIDPRIIYSFALDVDLCLEEEETMDEQ